MKILTTLILVLLAGAGAQAQVLRPGLGRTAGHEGRSERRDDGSGRHEGRHRHYEGHGHRHVFRPHFAHGYHGYGWSYPHSYYVGSRYYAPFAGHGAGTGFWLGALAGGIVGHNSGNFRHSAWRGAAWGAGLGWVLGAVADANRRTVVQQPAVLIQPAAVPVVQQPPAMATISSPVTLRHRAEGVASPLSAANAMFGRN